MGVTVWTLILGGLGAIGFFGRRRWTRRAAGKERDRLHKLKSAKDAEADRIACLELGKSLQTGVTSSRKAPSA